MSQIILSVHPHAAEDIRGLKLVDKIAAARIAKAIQQMDADRNLQDQLTDRRRPPNQWGNYDIKQWVGQQNAGRDLWRLKIFEAGEHAQSYRIVYAYERVAPGNSRPRIYVLAVFHKGEFDYENTPRTTQRIIADYDNL